MLASSNKLVLMMFEERFKFSLYKLKLSISNQFRKIRRLDLKSGKILELRCFIKSSFSKYKRKVKINTILNEI